MRIPRYINVRPHQTRPIPWGWENTRKGGRVWISKHPGVVKMPRLVEYFDFDDLEFIPDYGDIRDFPWSRDGLVVTRDMKSLWTTYTRFLGTEEALVSIAHDDEVSLRRRLEPILNEFIEFSLALQASFPGLTHALVGDDIASSHGLMMRPELAQVLVRLGTSYGLPVIFHSDGDLHEALLEVPLIKGYLYEPVGRMRGFLENPFFGRIPMFENLEAERETGYPVLN